MVKTIVQSPCGCGCGQTVSYKRIGAARISARGSLRFVKGHQHFLRRGSKHWEWKGGRIVDHHGYVVLQMRGHPLADTHGRVREHRLVMSQKLGRLLNREEHVHHINGNKIDNRPENLELVNVYNHNDHHPNPPRIRPDYICQNCGATFRRTGTRYDLSPPPTCSRECWRALVRKDD